jgi:methylmalonyl-CoA/ethylmalonyl-CoA epimerase
LNLSYEGESMNESVVHKLFNSIVFSKSEPKRDNIPFGIGEIGDIELEVKNIERASDFYKNKLGMSILYADSKSAICDCFGMRFLLTTKSRKANRAVMFLKVDEIHSAYKILKSRGVEFYDFPKTVVTLPVYTLWLAFFRDIDGNLLCLMKESSNHVIQSCNN